MVYEWVPQIIISIILIIVGIKLPIDVPIATLVRLALVIIGLAILVWGILGAYDQFSSALWEMISKMNDSIKQLKSDQFKIKKLVDELWKYKKNNKNSIW